MTYYSITGAPSSVYDGGYKRTYYTDEYKINASGKRQVHMLSMSLTKSIEVSTLSFTGSVTNLESYSFNGFMLVFVTENELVDPSYPETTWNFVFRDYGLNKTLSLAGLSTDAFSGSWSIPAGVNAANIHVFAAVYDADARDPTYGRPYAVQSVCDVCGSDTVSPNIEILSPENKTYTTNSVPLTFAISEPASWIGYSLDGQANVTITGNDTLTSLSDGAHYITVYANDTAGDMDSSDMIYFTVRASGEDNVPPLITHTPVTTGKEGQPISIIATITDNIAVTEASLFYRKTAETVYTRVIMSRSGDTYNGTIPASVVTTVGLEYYINATDGTNIATDPATNPTTSPHTIAVRDTTPPTVSVTINPTDPDTTQKVVFTVTAEDTGGSDMSNITLYIDDALVKTWTAAGTYTYNGGPYTEGTHTYYANACDSAGNNCRDPSSGEKTFTVSAPPQPLPLWQLLIVAVVLISLVAAISFALLRKK